jgi:streptogramin lyase
MTVDQSKDKSNPTGFNWKKNLYWIIGIVLIIAALLVFSQGKSSGWSSYPAGSISDMIVDPQGQVWYSSWSGSEIYPTKGDPILVPFPEDLEDKRIFSLAIDEAGQVYIGSSDGLVGIQDIKGDWSFFKAKDPELAPRIMEIAVDDRGQLWVVTNAGLAVIDPSENIAQYDYQPPGFLSEHIYDLSVDQDGQLWLLDSAGLMVLSSTDEWTSVPFDDFTYEEIWLKPDEIEFDVQGEIWLATPKHFLHQQGGVWIQEDFQGDVVVITDFVIDDQDRIWGATPESGLFLFEPGQGFTYYTARSSGLKDDDIDHIVIDGEGKIWIDTFAGLNILDPQELSSRSSAPNAVLGYQVIPVAVLAFIVIGIFVYIRSRPDLLAVVDTGQLIAGFIGWFVVNGIFWGALVGMAAGMGPAGIAMMFCFFVPLPANIIGILILFKKQRWIAIGAFSALGVNSILLLLNSAVFDTYSAPFMNLLFQIPFFLSGMLGF